MCQNNGRYNYNIKKELKKKIFKMAQNLGALAKEAECIVCYEPPRGAVNQCKNGHLLCYSCETTMRSRNR